MNFMPQPDPWGEAIRANNPECITCACRKSSGPNREALEWFLAIQENNPGGFVPNLNPDTRMVLR